MSDSWKEEAKNILAVKKLAEEGDEEAKQLVWLRRQLTTLEAEATTKSKPEHAGWGGAQQLPQRFFYSIIDNFHQAPQLQQHQE